MLSRFVLRKLMQSERIAADFWLKPHPCYGAAGARGLNGRDAINLDVKLSCPCGNADEDSSRRVLGKVAYVDLVNGRKLLDRRAIHIALQDVLQRRPRCFEAKLHLLKSKLGLALDRSDDYLAGVRIERRKPRNIQGIAMTRHDGSWRFPSFQIRGKGLDADDLPFNWNAPAAGGLGWKQITPGLATNVSVCNEMRIPQTART